MSHTNPFYTYSYTDPITDMVFYIGKGSKQRFRAHLQRAGGVRRKTDLPVVDKSRQLLSAGITPLIQILENFQTEQDAHTKEIALIAQIGRKDLGKGPLLNLTDGGEGSSGRVWSEERKRAWRGKNNPMFGKVPWKVSGKTNPMTGKKHSVDSRDKMSIKIKASYTTKLKQLRSVQSTGSNNPQFGKPAKNRKAVIFREIKFDCIKHASDYFNVSKGVVRKEGVFI